MALIELDNVKKRYAFDQASVDALGGVTLAIEEGEFIAVWGPSGSGKTTLLNMIGLIDAPTSGSVKLDGRKIDGLGDSALAELRNKRIGFIFQNFNLVPVFDAVENVALPLEIRGEGGRATREKAIRLLQEVGLGSVLKQRPDKMSGGQRQRVAIARALVTDPALVIADEPTANLDTQTALQIIELMRGLNEKKRVTFVFSTHDQRLLDHVRRKVRLEDGRIVPPPAGLIVAA